MPLMPVDFHPLHYNVAHPLLVLDAPLTAGDRVGALGMTLGEALRFTLPELGVVIDAKRDDGSAEVVIPVIDMLLLEPSARRFELVARRAFVQGRGSARLRELRAELRVCP
jgi:hypothetical protein